MPMHPSPRGKTSGPEAPNLIADRSFIVAPSGRPSAAASIRRGGGDRQHPGLTFAAGVRRQLLPPLLGRLGGRPGGEVLQLVEGAQLDLTDLAYLGPDPLGPRDRLVPGLDLDDPVAGDQLPGLGERPV